MIDSHCHLDAAEFDNDRDKVLAQALAAGVTKIINPAVCVENFNSVRQLSKHSLALQLLGQSSVVHYALGIHPIYVMQARYSDIELLRQAVAASLSDPCFVGIGEIGLDGFEPNIDRERQHWFFVEQLKVARDFELPVIMHVRHAVDSVLKQLRIFKPRSGIAHAFNGSEQQASQLIACQMALGFGGAMTFTRALQIRRLAAALPIDSLVLETDSPDISPCWVHPERNSPDQVPQIASVLAQLRDVPVSVIESATNATVNRVLNWQ